MEGGLWILFQGPFYDGVDLVVGVVVLLGVEGRSWSPSLRVCLVLRKRVKKDM